MNIQDIQTLRKQTGAGIQDVKNALEQSDGDIDKARLVLREQGIKIVNKKEGRDTGDGLVFSYVHNGGKIGVLLTLYCETDFVARTPQFQELGRDIALHIAAAKPQYVTEDDIPEAVLEEERGVYRNQMKDENKPEDVVEKIISGKIQKFVQEVSLLPQPFIKDPQKTIQQRVEDAIVVLGENIQVGEFVCFEVK